MLAWKSLGDIHLLIVEDDPFSILLIRNILNKIPQFHFYEAKNGIEALEVLSEHSVDVILLDYHMPKMNGYETLVEIRKNKDYDEIVVFPITTDDEEKRKFYAQGANDFISKPFRIEELENKIYQSLLARKTAHSDSSETPKIGQDQVIHPDTPVAYTEKEIEKSQKDFFIKLVSAQTRFYPKERNRLKSIATISKEFALKLGCSIDDANNIYYAALIRDIGLCGMDEKHKRYKTTEYYRHIQIGHQMLKGSIETDFIKIARIVILQYHEYYDGSGVPYGLTKNHIDKKAQLVAIVERFELLLGGKSDNGEPYSSEEVYDILSDQSAKQFNPKLLRVFLKHFSEFITLRHKLLNSSK